MLSCERRQVSWDTRGLLYSAAPGAGVCWNRRGRVVIVIIVVVIGIGGLAVAVEAAEGIEGGGLRRDLWGT